MRTRIAVLLCGLVVAGAIGARAMTPLSAQSDLDDFMARVLASRDENWKKLRQYVLDEREQVEVVGPGRLKLWGDQREYTWFIREGFFVRSPTKANGATVSEADRRKYEDDFLQRARVREKGRTDIGTEVDGTKVASPAPQTFRSGVPASGDTRQAPSSVEGLIGQTRQPQFIDSAYFLRFKFEQGRYALVGREAIEGRALLRIEYYPSRLFTHEQNAEDERKRERRREPNEDVEAATEKMMNKVSLVTLWIDADAHQIVRYTFDNIDLDFLPGAWLMRMDGIRASMTMSQAFTGVWLPHEVDVALNGITAVGDVGVHYHLDYHDYREATSSGRVVLPAAR
jgi:hypothetical protein